MQYPGAFPDIDAYVVQALTELQSKSLAVIQVETALTWCGRACAAERLELHVDATEYGHEAIEHAALSGNDELLRLVRSALAEYGVDT